MLPFPILCDMYRSVLQWMSVGSGIEHAEGGGTPKGQRTHGFQIWLKMPKSNMEDAPRYGTVQPDEIPTVPVRGGVVRVIAGSLGETPGPAKFAVTVQILDVELKAGGVFDYERPANMDNVMFCTALKRIVDELSLVLQHLLLVLIEHMPSVPRRRRI